VSRDQGAFPVEQNLSVDVIDCGSRAESWRPRAYAKEYERDKPFDPKSCIHRDGEDLQEIRDWK
jgi:hypothetical protein